MQHFKSSIQGRKFLGGRGTSSPRNHP